MKQRSQSTFWNRPPGGRTVEEGGPLAGHLLRAADAGLLAIVCLAPYLLGGRNDVGRFVFVALVAITTTAWFFRQSLVSTAKWTRTAAHAVMILAVALVVLQLVPLPATWLARLAPRTAELLPLWTTGASPVNVGAWRTLSLTPHDTVLCLAMLVSYCLVFVVVTQRVQSVSDVWRLLSWIALAAAAMAAFGLVQYFTSNGRFFWFYEHPFRTTDDYVKGSFVNRNHFANFLVLGTGPLVAWLIRTLREQVPAASRPRRPTASRAQIVALLLGIALVTMLVAVLLSLSRGGFLALFTATTVLGGVYLRWGLVDAKHAGGVVGLVVVLFGLLSVYGYEKVAGRLDDFASGSLETMDREDGRRKIWSANAAAFQHGWMTGAGAGSHREIYPVYLHESLSREYTHAENGYLQVATETGAGGVVLLLAALALCGSWCLTCLRRLDSEGERLCFGAVAAGLAACAVHSLVDFVWYIPACMSVTLILAACAVRLAHFGLPAERRAAREKPLSRSRWFELAAAGALAGAWCVISFFDAAVASVHWNRYLRASTDNTELATQQLSAMLGTAQDVDSALVEPLSDAMLRHLQDAARRDPSNARVQLKLAGKCIARFELLQRDAANAMPLSQIRAAANASNFESTAELRDWLERAVGTNVKWLYSALEHARRAAALCPLQGEAYIRIAQLSFLEGAPRQVADAYIAQGERVRPYDGDVLFEIGMHRLMSGQLELAVQYWARCFRDRGDHQPRIVQILAGRGIPAAILLEALQPDWRTLRQIWDRYCEAGTDEDRRILIDYAAQVTQRQAQEKHGIPPAYIWFWQASMYSDVGRPLDAINCLELANRHNPNVYDVRFALARALMNAERFPEAEPHVRWCLARRPAQKYLKASLVEIKKHRISLRDEGLSAPQ